MSDRDPVEQWKYARALLLEIQPRRERAQDRFDAAAAELTAVKRQEAVLEELVEYWYQEVGRAGRRTETEQIARPAASALKSQVDAALSRLGRPARITAIHAEIQKEHPNANYYSVRTILDRGFKRGDYVRIGHDYAHSAVKEIPVLPASSETPVEPRDEQWIANSLFPVEEEEPAAIDGDDGK